MGHGSRRLCRQRPYGGDHRPARRRNPVRDAEEIQQLVHPDDRDALSEKIQQGLRTEGRYEAEYRLRPGPNGEITWLRAAGIQVLNAKGEVTSICGVVQNITDRRVEEDQRRTLMAEVDHRVKNVLAAVQSLAYQTAKRTTSLESFLSNFSGRLKSMGSANELLTAARWRGAGSPTWPPPSSAASRPARPAGRDLSCS
uniref:histidine kinase n=1 Tax=Phenylobacterium glaciei TaxID=2803784 RepID=A0A974P5E2_9CAUL|nr:PAS domain-containing protein [Phenylobacterium glaciei]